jgi:hypothetical protein
LSVFPTAGKYDGTSDVGNCPKTAIASAKQNPIVSNRFK